MPDGGRTATNTAERTATAGQIQWDNQLDAFSANLVRRRSAASRRAKSNETGQLACVCLTEVGP